MITCVLTFKLFSHNIFLSISFFLFFFVMLCGKWDLVPRPGFEPVPPPLGVQSPLDHQGSLRYPVS